MIEPLVIDFVVGCSPGHAFELWTTRASTWWPADHSNSGHPDLDVIFEPRVGGRIYERTPDGREHDWGEITTWDPPERLCYSWHMTSDPSTATEVEITFAASEAGTAVRIEHRGWEHFAGAATERRNANRRGWGDVLVHYRSACDQVDS